MSLFSCYLGWLSMGSRIQPSSPSIFVLVLARKKYHHIHPFQAPAPCRKGANYRKPHATLSLSSSVLLPPNRDMAIWLHHSIPPLRSWLLGPTTQGKAARAHGSGLLCITSPPHRLAAPPAGWPNGMSVFRKAMNNRQNYRFAVYARQSFNEIY